MGKFEFCKRIMPKLRYFLSADSFSSALQVVPKDHAEEADYFQKKKEDSFVTVP